jgi:hypothetical protein
MISLSIMRKVVRKPATDWLTPKGKAGGLQIRRCQGLAVIYYGGTLDALTLKPSGFCNIGVNLKSAAERSDCPAYFSIKL